MMHLNENFKFIFNTIELADSFVKTLEWLKDNHTTREPIESYDAFE